MKKMTVFLLALSMIGTLTACGQAHTETSTAADSIVVESIAESIADINTSEESKVTEAGQTEETQMETKILVAYFSATHNTEGVAEKIADGLNADLYEIVPEQPYTDADLDYHDNNSRSTLEMADASVRPEISGTVENMDQYDIVFIGYPIWWGDAPRILSTFVESYDFSGKTIVPFCTSGSSGIATSASNLEQLTDEATWLSGQRLESGASVDTVMEWVDSLGLNLNH